MCGGCVKRAGECETRDSSGSGQLGSCLPGRPALDVCRMCQADVSSWQLSRRRALRAVSCEPVHAARGQRLVDCCLRVRGGIHKRDTHTRACSHAVPASWTPSRTEITIVKLLAAENPNTVSRSLSLCLAGGPGGLQVCEHTFQQATLPRLLHVPPGFLCTGDACRRAAGVRTHQSLHLSSRLLYRDFCTCHQASCALEMLAGGLQRTSCSRYSRASRCHEGGGFQGRVCAREEWKREEAWGVFLVCVECFIALLQRYYSSHSSDRRAVLLCCCVESVEK